jgi:putative aldouronate transport system substrate-binding protein
MKMSGKMSKPLALLFACLLALSLTACSGSTSPAATQGAAATSAPADATQSAAAATPAAADTSVTPLTILVAGSPITIDHKSRVQQALTKATGVSVTIEAVDNDKLNVLLAGGDLPDMARVGTNLFNQMIEGNNVIPLDDLLQSKGQDILKNVPTAVTFSKKFWSDSQDKVFFLPMQVGPSAKGIEQTLGLVVRWDYYTKAGYPEVKNLDDYLNVLAAMVKANPKTPDGKPTYGVSAFSDWGNWSYFYPMIFLEKYYTISGSATELYGLDTKKVVSMLTEENGCYWQSVNFYRKAYQLGILDPDSFTQKYDDFYTKATNGQLISVPATWCAGDFISANSSKGLGYAALPVQWGINWGSTSSVLGWTDKCMSITTNCKTPEKAMGFINYLYSFDGARLLYNGVKGTDWDGVGGQSTITDSTLQLYLAGGKPYTDTGIASLDDNFIGLSDNTMNPADNKTLNLFNDSSVYAKLMTPVQKDFSAHYGVDYPFEAFDKAAASNPAYIKADGLDIVSALLPTTPDDDISRMEGDLNNLAVKYGAKMILAKDDTEFDTVKKEAQAAFTAAGVQKVNDWYTQQWATASQKAEEVFPK